MADPKDVYPEVCLSTIVFRCRQVKTGLASNLLREDWSYCNFDLRSGRERFWEGRGFSPAVSASQNRGLWPLRGDHSRPKPSPDRSPLLSHTPLRSAPVPESLPQPRRKRWSLVTDSASPNVDNPLVTPDALTRTVQDFLSEAAGAVVLENGAVAFDLAQSKYSISGEYNKCLLHLWSAERNTVRRVLDAEVKNGTLKLSVQRLGQSRPTKLEICREHDRRSPDRQEVARSQLRTEAPPRPRSPFPSLHCYSPHHRRRSRKILRPHLRPRTSAPGPVRLRRARGQRLRNAGLDRCVSDLRHSLARSLPPVFCNGKFLVEGLRSICSPRMLRTGSRAHGQPESSSRPNGASSNSTNAMTPCRDRLHRPRQRDHAPGPRA